MVKNKFMTLLIFLAAMALITSACGGLPTKGYLVAKKEATKTRPAYQRFQKLCNGEDPPSLKEPLLIEGYLTASTYGRDCDRDGWHSVTEGKFEFFECYTESITDYKDLKNGVIYRFEIDKDNNGKCPVYDPVSDKYKEKYSDLISEGVCLIKRKVIETNSRYARLSEWGYMSDDNRAILSMSHEQNKDVIIFRGYSIIDIEYGRLLSVLNRKYTYIPDIEQDDLNFVCEYGQEHGSGISWYQLAR